MSTLSLAELEANDPRAPQRERERRFLCIYCGDGKPQDAAHRSLTANMESGAWNCKRCGATGKLREFWTEAAPVKARSRVRGSLRRAAVPTLAPIAPEPNVTNWRAGLPALAPLRGTAGQEYLQKRGIACETAHAAGVRFARDFYGRAAVVFPIRDRASTLVAAQGRYLDACDNPKARTTGHKRDGVFHAPVCLNGRAFAPLDKSTPAIIICEAPIDALSIASAGYPAIALCGTTGPDWLHLACGFRRVLLAFDGDAAGDKAAGELSGVLSTFGASCERMRPENGKDFNEMLCNSGAAALCEYLAARVLLDCAAQGDAADDEYSDEYSIFD